jgi:hypothetical protein
MTKKLMICRDNSAGYQNKLTIGKTYEVEIVPGIFESRPFVEFTDDDGKTCGAHKHRFEDADKDKKQ